MFASFRGSVDCDSAIGQSESLRVILKFRARRVEEYMPSVVLYCSMRRTITIRLSEELAEWLAERACKTGEPAGSIIRHQLKKAKTEGGRQRFLRHAGKIDGSADLSMRKGFARR